MANLITIRSYYHEERKYTPEEYIKFRIIDNSSHKKYCNIFADKVGVVTKEELKKVAKEKYGINIIRSKSTKEEMLDLILKSENIFALADMLKIGVKWYQYADSFGLSLQQILKLEEKGFLKIIASELNKYMYNESIYELKQFADMTKEKIENAIVQYNAYKSNSDILIDDVNFAFENNKAWNKFMSDADEYFKELDEFTDDPEGFMKRINSKKII